MQGSSREKKYSSDRKKGKGGKGGKRKDKEKLAPQAVRSQRAKTKQQVKRLK